MTKLSDKFLNNLKNPEPQKKLRVIFCSMPESDGSLNWTVALSGLDSGLTSFDNIIIYRGEYFDQARYYGDLMKYILGIGDAVNEPKPWFYNERLKEAPKDFDFVAYSEEFAQNQEYLELQLYCTPESNGRTNWRVTLGSKKLGEYSHTFFLTEIYNRAHFTYEEILYAIGQRTEEPDIEDYPG